MTQLYAKSTELASISKYIIQSLVSLDTGVAAAKHNHLAS